MKYAVTSQEMKLYDRNTSEYYGVGTDILMERASLSVAEEIDAWRQKRNAKRRYTVLILAGVGNNGGDGICTGRLLRQKGYVVYLCIIGDMTKSSDLFLKQLTIAEKYGIPKIKPTSLDAENEERSFDVIVDAMFGIGLSRNLTGDYLNAVKFINSYKKERGSDLLVTSIDIPTGINADSGKVCGDAVRADVTVTFNFTKLGHIFYPGCEYTGELRIGDAGITKESFLSKDPIAFFYESFDDIGLVRRRDSNKGTNGKVLIIAGSKNISGACVLAASACLRAGAGMVRIFTDRENAEVVRALLPEAILDTYDDFEPVSEKLQKAFEWSTQAVIGPGIGTEGKGRELVLNTLRFYDKSLIMDADALNLIADDEQLMKLAQNYSTNSKRLILTPHMGEFSRLMNREIKECKEHVLEYTKMLAGRIHATILCKDSRSVVADSNEKKLYINVSGNDGMATAGSGDVLSGILGALLSQNMNGFEVAAAGAYLHGCAGDAASRKCGRYSMVATDIVAALSDVMP
ncbi:MAG: NAD(P)H-hydrate dehydratase [Butyrivibrio sp.]|nr:NAD(P)H-hydrate dehydratase [Butyrivibrio sp.]